MKRIIERTEDGSATLFVPELDEHYHSVKGARTESQHIFINMGLKASAAPQPHVLEIGFGTGLNALLTLEAAEQDARPVHYTGGSLSAYYGSAGVVAMIATFVVLVIAAKSLREEDSFQLFPRLGLGLTLLDMVCWIGTYIWGFLS